MIFSIGCILRDRSTRSRLIDRNSSGSGNDISPFYHPPHPIRSLPPIPARNASGMVTLPSSF